MLPRCNVAPAGISRAVFIGTLSPSSVTPIGAPVTAITASQLKRNSGPLMVISSAAAPSALPSKRLPRRNARLSIGPDGGTPTAQ
ncbi:hypothetical protein D3C81_1667360 [compost metagenome]